MSTRKAVMGCGCALFLIVAFGIILSGGCFKQIPPSSVGVRFSGRNGISEKLLKPQVTFVGIGNRLIIYPTSIKNASFVRTATEGVRKRDDSILASTVEGAILPVDITVSWHVDPANVVIVFENFGLEDVTAIQDTYIRVTVTYAVNTVSGQKSIFDLTSKERAQFGPSVKKILSPILAEFGITVDDVYVGEVFPNAEITKKVNERVSKRNELEQAIIGLEQSRIDAKTTLTNAKKQAELNAMLAAQGEKAVELKKLENLRKAIDAWDGNPSSVGDGTIPFTTIDPRTGIPNSITPATK